MLVFSKMKKLLKNNNLLQMYNFIPDELKEEFHRRSQDFIKQNSLKAWKDFLKSWYKKEDASTPKGIGDYFKSMFRHMRDVNKRLPNKKKWYYGKKKIKRKSKMKKEKISQSLKKKCKKLKVRLTVKRKGKRVYKSVKVLKRQCEKAVKKGKRKFGAARKSGRVVPRKSHFGRPYFGYTVGGKVRFGSRRPEFHYPERVLTGYNTAKTNRKFRFGRPHRHPLRYSSYNPSKTGKKFRFGQVKPLLDGYARSEAADDAAGFMFANPLGGFLPWSFLGTKAGNRTNAERIAFFMSSSGKKGKKKMSKKQAKKYLKIMDKIIQKKKITEKEKDFVVSFKLFSKRKLNKTIWCIKNPGKCGGIKFIIEIAGQVGLHAAVVAFLIGGMTLAYKVYDYFKGNNPLVSNPLQDVPPPRGLRNRHRREHRQRESLIEMYRNLKIYLLQAYDLGTRSDHSQNNDEELNEMVKQFYLTGASEEEFNNLDQGHIATFQRMFKDTYTQGLNGQNNSNVHACDLLIQGLNDRSITMQQIRAMGPPGQNPNVAIPVQSIRPIHVDEMVGLENLPTTSNVQQLPMGAIQSSSNRLVGADNAHLNEYGRRKRKVKRKKRKVKKRKVKKRKVKKRKGKKKK